MTQSKKKYTTVGSVLKRKEGKGSYVKLTHDIKAGTILNVQNPRTFHKELLEAGKISPEVAAKFQERADRVPEFVQFDLVLSENKPQE